MLGKRLKSGQEEPLSDFNNIFYAIDRNKIIGNPISYGLDVLLIISHVKGFAPLGESIELRSGSYC